MQSQEDDSPNVSHLNTSYEFQAVSTHEEPSTLPISTLQRLFGAGSLIGSMFTTLACTVGIGILSLPYAVNLSGLVLGDLTVIIGMLLSFYTCRLLLVCAEKVGKPTYEEVGISAYGKSMGTFVNLNMIINNYGTLIAYMVLIQQLIPDALRNLGVSNEGATSGLLWGGFISLCIVFPLSLLKEVSAFRYSSVISFITSVVICIVIVLEFFVDRRRDLAAHIENAEMAKIGLYNLIEGVPIVVFAFTCHQNVLYIYAELRSKTVSRGSSFIFSAMLLALILYLLTGTFGYLTFDSEYSTFSFPSQILTGKYGKNNAPIILCDFLITVPIICAMPLTVQPCRDSLYAMIWKDSPVPKVYHVSIVSFMLGSSFLIGYFAKSIGIVLTFLGSVSNPIICFLLPTLFYIRLFPGKHKGAFFAIFVFGLMALISLAAFILIIIQLSGGN